MFRMVTISVLLCLCLYTTAQETDNLSYADQLAALEAEMDSMSIFNLIDSLFNSDFAAGSELNIRFGITSSVTSAGRDYDLNQTGFSPGISYYHKSGFYSDLSGYWNSGVEPSYNPTIISAGYLGSIGEKWGYSFDYEKWFFNPNDSSDNPLRNSLGTSVSYDFKFGYASIDYSILFGSETAHRIIGNLSGNIRFGKWWIFKDVNMYPSVNIVYGNNSITQLRITQEQLTNQQREQFERLIQFSELTDRQRFQLLGAINRAFENGQITEARRNELYILLNQSRELTEADVQQLQGFIDNGVETQDFTDGNAFGLMNYSFTLPISLSTERWNFMFSYTYSIPVQLPGEFFSVDPIGYFGASISYRIRFK